MRKIFLILCLLFVVICYGYPCLILPFGTYKQETNIGGTKYETTYKFKIDGKVEISVNDAKDEYYYKLNGNELIISEDKKFDKNDSKIAICSLYNVNGAVNLIGEIIAIGIGVITIILVATIPHKKR